MKTFTIFYAVFLSYALAKTLSEDGYTVRTTSMVSTKGPFAVVDAIDDGQLITIENVSKKEECLTGWTVTRYVDGRAGASYTFEQLAVTPEQLAVPPGQCLKIYSSAAAQMASDMDHVANVSTWGVGGNVVTTLLNKQGEIRATLTKKVTYSA